ncbi:sugar-binding protein [Cerasicoccus fimbriatus]|uniref:sugar-binding protein n=1 Tax=Cerasicoccus fimbriatus TaxID=3014554 RepID=UPI0022B4B693|nr:sugar-binding protein [Cerasicoccus sp. TK19100]
MIRLHYRRMRQVFQTIALQLGLVLFALPASAQETVTEESDWATIEYPSSVHVGEPFDVRLTILKPVPVGTKLAADLYWMKADGGFGGMLSYGSRKDAVVGEAQTVRLNVSPKPDMAAVQVTAFLSPDGDWESRQEVLRGPVVPVVSGGSGKNDSLRPEGVDFKKSWLSIQSPAGSYTEGDDFTVTVDYYLDPSESWGGGTELYLSALGPWIDNPDGQYTTSRTHIDIPGLTGSKSVRIEPGLGSKQFHYTVPKLHAFNDLLFIGGFKMDGGKQNWPWYLRASGPTLMKTHDFYDLTTSKAGNLFTYDEPVIIEVQSRKGTTTEKDRRLSYTITNVDGRTQSGVVEFRPAPIGQSTSITLPIEERGTFVLKTMIEDWGEREMVFARIPDLVKEIADTQTKFGVTNVRTDAENEIARRLGFSWVRHFFSWSEVRPGRDRWNTDGWDAILRTNVEHDITPWLCLVYPPAWVQTGDARNVPYVPYGFDHEGLTTTVQTLSQRWGGQIWGWEWQNEIVPGDLVEDPVGNYIDFVRTGSNAVHAVDPKLKIQLAGGLWPRNFRNDLLNQGVAEYIDVLPVHYGNYDAVRDAQSDLSAVGEKDRVAVWDNETSFGYSVWQMPLTEMIQHDGQSQWIMDRWTAELSAGAEQITLFGGHADPAGNWSYLLDSATVRPYATTAAVFISKMAQSKPLGQFFFGQGAVAHLFDQDGEAVLVLSAPGIPGQYQLPVGAPVVTVTDDQGRDRKINTTKGVLSLALGDMPVFVEGGNLNTLKANIVLEVGSGDRPQPLPQLTAVTQSDLLVPLRIYNPYDRSITIELVLQAHDAPKETVAKKLNLTAGEQQILELKVAASNKRPKSGSEAWKAMIRFPGAQLPTVEKPFIVSWIEPESLDNLLSDSGFESAEVGRAGWSVLGEGGKAPSNDSLGTGKQWLNLQSANEGWLTASQSIDLPSGRPFLYTMWAHPKNVQQGGSNITYHLADGKQKTLYIPHVFQTPSDSDSWLLLSYQGEAPADTLKVDFSPVVNPSKEGGSMLVDNVRVTLYEGSDYATEAHEASSAPQVDGKLNDWPQGNPIPLLAVNQLKVDADDYQWTPENLSGVAYFQWDNEALYFAADIVDDQSVVPNTGNETINSDSLTLAFQPSRLGVKSNDRAFAYYLSAASPGGGSGKFTLYRPEQFSGGLMSGHLAKDSSAYEVAIKREGNRTTYEAKFPWTELGGLTPQLGARMGLSISLADNDGDGRTARILWGRGLDPVWEPSQFGVLTLVGPIAQ